MKPGSSAQSELLGQLDLDDLPVLDDQRNGPEPHAPKDGSHPSHTDHIALLCFAGHAGWGPAQLEGEVEVGGWFVLDAVGDDALTAEVTDEESLEAALPLR